MLLYSVRFSNVRFNFYNTESIEELFFSGKFDFQLDSGLLLTLYGFEKNPEFFWRAKFCKKSLTGTDLVEAEKK